MCILKVHELSLHRTPECLLSQDCLDPPRSAASPGRRTPRWRWSAARAGAAACTRPSTSVRCRPLPILTDLLNCILDILLSTFSLSELWDGEDQILLRNVSQLKRPRFELDSLQSGRRLIIRIYSANKKGKYGPSGGTQRYFYTPHFSLKSVSPRSHPVHYYFLSVVPTFTSY